MLEMALKLADQPLCAGKCRLIALLLKCFGVLLCLGEGSLGLCKPTLQLMPSLCCASIQGSGHPGNLMLALLALPHPSLQGVLLAAAQVAFRPTELKRLCTFCAM